MPVAIERGGALHGTFNYKTRPRLQFRHVDVNKLNSAGTVQIGQRFETLAAPAQATGEAYATAGQYARTAVRGKRMAAGGSQRCNRSTHGLEAEANKGLALPWRLVPRKAEPIPRKGRHTSWGSAPDVSRPGPSRRSVKSHNAACVRRISSNAETARER